MVKKKDTNKNLCGWIPPDQRTRTQSNAHQAALLSMPKFNIIGRTDGSVDKVFLFDLWKHDLVKNALGYSYDGMHQLTGSCVGVGGGNVIFSVIAVDSILRGDRESIVIPFWLIPYGRSRYYCGMTSPGEGSMGSAFAKAAKEDGVLDAKQSGLPTFNNSDGLIWGEKTEYSWSDGDAQQTMKLLPESRKHLIKTTAQCNNSDQVREALINGYPCTCASSWGGLMQCSVTEGVLLNRRTGTWNHQQSIQGWWNHPKLGEIFYIMNQWGKGAHGKCPSGAPEGGYWIKKGEVDWMCNDGQEVFAFSQFEGFPSQTLPKELFKII